MNLQTVKPRARLVASSTGPLWCVHFTGTNAGGFAHDLRIAIERAYRSQLVAITRRRSS